MKGRPCLARKEEGGGDRDLAFALTLSPLTDEEREEGVCAGLASEGAPSPERSVRPPADAFFGALQAQPPLRGLEQGKGHSYSGYSRA